MGGGLGAVPRARRARRSGRDHGGPACRGLRGRRGHARGPAGPGRCGWVGAGAGAANRRTDRRYARRGGHPARRRRAGTGARSRVRRCDRDGLRGSDGIVRGVRDARVAAGTPGSPGRAVRDRLVRAYFRTLGALAPRAAAQRAFALAAQPSARPRVSSAARALLERAEPFTVDADDRRLCAYRWRGNGAAAGTVLLAHGWNSRAAHFTPWVEPLLARALDVVAFDMPAHGESEGRRTDGLDMARALGCVAGEVGQLRGVVGHSAGAYAAAAAAAGNHLLGRPPVAVERLVLIAGLDDPLLHFVGVAGMLRLGPAAGEELLRLATAAYGHPLTAFALTRIPGGWPQPTLLFHDPGDPEVPFSEARALAAAFPNITLLPAEGFGHRRILRAPGVIERAVDFLAAGSAGGGPEPTATADARRRAPPGAPASRWSSPGPRAS
ncbi:MAG: alpha/beta hydrolase [Gemmatimonadetes bacterium]|nr:alpha/beta hydrolase [Gemmatimonadota bacterium]